MSEARTGPGKPGRVYAARLVGLPIYDPQGDQVAKDDDDKAALRRHFTDEQIVFGRMRDLFDAVVQPLSEHPFLFRPAELTAHANSSRILTT